MVLEQNKERIRILEQVLKVISYIYYHSQTDKKIKKIAFLNGAGTTENVAKADIQNLLLGHTYDGMTRIGQQLKRHILKPLATTGMKKPLLVMVLTDGRVCALSYCSGI